MADAILTQRLVTGVAPLALLFLIIVVAVVAGVGAAALITWVDRYIHADTEQTVANIPDELFPASPAVDTEPGIDLGLRDECDRILAASQYIDPAGIARLKNAIREQQKGKEA